MEYKKGEEQRRFKNAEKARNEALDCSIYEMAAFRLRQWNFDAIEEKIIAELKPLQVETKKPQAERPHGFIPQVASWI